MDKSDYNVQSVRIPMPVYNALKEYAKERGWTMTKVMNYAFVAYLKEEIDPWWETHPKGKKKYDGWE